MSMKSSVLCVAAVLALAGAAQADFVTNGDFETGSLAGWTQFGDTTFDGVAAVPHSGNFGAFFGAIGSVSGISQALTIPANSHVLVSFWLHNDGGNPNFFDVSFDGASLMSLTDAGAISYNQYSFVVTTTSANPTLTFSFQQNPAFWYLDDVSVTSTVIPLPTGAGMGLAGLAGVGLLGRIARRRK